MEILVFPVIGFLVIAIPLGLIPAMVAKNKGRSFLDWWVYGSLLFPIALAQALLLKPQGLKKCQFCAEMIKPDAKVCRYCGRGLPPPAEPEEPEAASPPTTTCPACGASIFATQKYCDVCSAARGQTWHLIVDRRAAEARREVLVTALRGLSLDPAVSAVNEREVKVASGATLQQANALMVRLHEVGMISRKRQDWPGDC
jgi:hypothetical protein